VYACPAVDFKKSAQLAAYLPYFFSNPI